jgi:hypothetical protein
MNTVTVRGVLKTCPATGARKWAGYVSEDTEVPAGLVAASIEVLDPEDQTGNRWILAVSEPLTPLDSATLDALAQGDAVRLAKSKLTDADLAALGLTRE